MQVVSYSLRDYMLTSKWAESYCIYIPYPCKQEVGHVVINEHPDMLVLYKLCIDSEYRRKGYAYAFLMSLPRNKRVRLAVDKDNVAARNLYHKAGFRLLGKSSYNWLWMERPADPVEQAIRKYHIPLMIIIYWLVLCIIASIASNLFP